jgi:hypothetical protein
MKGYGLTVFRGTEPERFDVEVIDVLRNFQPDQDLILVRTRHPVLEQAIVVAGMSGSPVYLEGKLAGAYAYGWLFGKEPIAGVTPIANMMAELGRAVDPRVWKAIGASPRALLQGSAGPSRRGSARANRAVRDKTQLAGLPPYLGRTPVDAFEPLRQYDQLYPRPTLGDETTLRPALTPVMYSGLDPSVARIMDEQLGRFGLVGLQAGGGARPANASGPPPRYVNGGAIGIELMRGDISMTGVGTVTHVLGDRLVAFGHPMMNAGQVGLPTCTARVLHVLANQRRSFKIAEAESPLGSMVHDRQSAVVIDTKVVADTVPIEVRVQGVPQAQRSRWNMEMASHRMLTPLFAFSAVAGALSASAVDQTDVSFSARSRVHVQGHGVVETRDFGYSPGGAASPLALAQLRLFPVLDATYGNPFESVRIERIEVDLALRFERDVITILDALAPSTEVDPGRDVRVYLTLKPFGKPEEIRAVTVRVPRSAAGQKLELSFEPGNRVQIERPEPSDLSQLLSNLQLGYPATSLVISAKLPSQGLSLRGQMVRGLPGSALDSLQLGTDSARPVPFATHTRNELPLGHIVEGSARVTLDVRTEPLR